MAEYIYKSINQKGKILQGRMHASSVLDLESRINNQRQDLISHKEVRARGFQLGTKRLNRKDQINLVVQLEQLTKAGVPLLDSLIDLRDSADLGYYRDVLAGLVESIEAGKTFSEGLQEYEKDFDHVFVSLVQIGEESGELDKVLADMGKSLRWVDELEAQTVKILIYPAIVGIVVLLVTSFLMIYLVPQIIPFILEMGSEVPMHTLALITVSEFFVNYWWLIFSLPIVLATVIKKLTKINPKFRYRIDQLKLNIPIFGNITFKVKLARLANYMALLYSSGITVLRSLEICKSLMGNAVLEKAMEDVHIHISDGLSISDSFKMTQIFPPLVVRMISVGENTGNLDESLMNVSYFYNREVQDAIDKLEPAITPILTVILGGLLGWIMISVLGPVWDAIGTIGA